MRHNPPPVVTRAVYAILLTWAIALTWHFARTPFETVLATFEDDAFYYLTIARHMAVGDGSTFDGIHRTNGYHPLWCWTLVPLMRIFTDQPESGVRATAILCVWLRLGASVLLLRVLRRGFIRPWAAAIAALAFFTVGNGFSTNGMEEAVQMLCLTAFLVALRGGLPASTLGRGVILPAVLLGLLLLARLDTIFILLAYFAAAAWHIVRLGPSAERCRGTCQMLLQGSIVMAMLGGYLLSNALQFDTVMPISGVLKSSFPHVTAGYSFWTNASTGQQILILHAVLFTFAALAALASPRLRRWLGWRRTRELRGVCCWATGLMAYLGYQLLFGKWGNVFSWYYQPFAFLGAVALGAWVQIPAHWVEELPLKGSPRWTARVRTATLAACSLMLTAVLISKHRSAPDFHIACFHAGRWVAEHVPGSRVFALKDSGAFGYFSERRVINLDGLTNNRHYQDTLRDEGIAPYLRRERVDFLVTHSLRWAPKDVQAGTYNVYSPRYRSIMYSQDAGSVDLHRAQEVLRLPYKSADGFRNSLVIWDIAGRGEPVLTQSDSGLRGDTRHGAD